MKSSGELSVCLNRFIWTHIVRAPKPVSLTGYSRRYSVYTWGSYRITICMCMRDLVCNSLDNISPAYYTNAMSCVINAEYKCSLQKIITNNNKVSEHATRSMARTRQTTHSHGGWLRRMSAGGWGTAAQDGWLRRWWQDITVGTGRRAGSVRRSSRTSRRSRDACSFRWWRTSSGPRWVRRPGGDDADELPGRCS